jgi:CheY-like chemotaxis protein
MTRHQFQNIILLLASVNVGAPLKIIVIDDDEDDQQLFIDALADLKIPVNLTVSFDGLSFLDYLKTRNQKPDVIFLDLNMPGIGGKKILDDIRNRTDEFRDIPIIIYTTSVAYDDILSTYNKGANLYFPKPNSFGQLVTQLNQVLYIDWTKFPPRTSMEKYTSLIDKNFP